MRLIFNFLVLSFIFGGVISCKKKDAFFVLTGTVNDVTFNTSLNNAQVDLYQVNAGSAEVKLVETALIGSDGKYSFRIKRDKIEKFILKIHKLNYFEIEKTIYFAELSVEKDNVYNFETKAKGWLRLNLNNLNPQPTDVLEYVRQQGKYGCTECCPNGVQLVYGANNSSTICVNDGNTVYEIFYKMQGQSVGTMVSINTVAFDTTDLTINY